LTKDVPLGVLMCYSQKFRGHAALGGNASPSSFRDPDGCIFNYNGEVLRRVNPSYASCYKQLMSSGLYAHLTDIGFLIPHEEVSYAQPLFSEGELILRPKQLPFISYPYEWSFGQLQEAAILTLDVLAASLDRGMILKDASAFNVTWHKGRAVFFDTLSFTPYEDGSPWTGYRQFCTHFLAPLALMAYTDFRLQKLLLQYIDGVPLDLTSRLLPFRTRLKPSLSIHLHMHSYLQKKKANTRHKLQVRLKKKSLYNLIANLRNCITALKFPKVQTEWGDYYNDTNYTVEQAQRKQSVITGWLERVCPSRVADLGANDGTYSVLAARSSELVVAMDFDPVAVQANYLMCKTQNQSRITPLLNDITAPSPAIGWHCRERSSIFERLRPHMGMALALVHHLSISNNVPFLNIFSMFADMAPTWIVEFVDKKDTQVQRLLTNRPDIFPEYTQSMFEEQAKAHFFIEQKHHIEGTQRTLYLLRLKGLIG
jgi:hypothetical protein